MRKYKIWNYEWDWKKLWESLSLSEWRWKKKKRIKKRGVYEDKYYR